MNIKLAVYTAIEGYDWQTGVGAFSKPVLNQYKRIIGRFPDPSVDVVPFGGMFVCDGNVVFYRYHVAIKADSKGRDALYLVLGACSKEEAGKIDFRLLFGMKELAEPMKPSPSEVYYEGSPSGDKPEGLSFDESFTEYMVGVASLSAMGAVFCEAPGEKISAKIEGTDAEPAITIKYTSPARLPVEAEHGESLKDGHGESQHGEHQESDMRRPAADDEAPEEDERELAMRRDTVHDEGDGGCPPPASFFRRVIRELGQDCYFYLLAIVLFLMGGVVGYCVHGIQSALVSAQFQPGIRQEEGVREKVDFSAQMKTGRDSRVAPGASQNGHSSQGTAETIQSAQMASGASQPDLEKVKSDAPQPAAKVVSGTSEGEAQKSKQCEKCGGWGAILCVSECDACSEENHKGCKKCGGCGVVIYEVYGPVWVDAGDVSAETETEKAPQGSTQADDTDPKAPKCGLCKGKGIIKGESCPACHGRGKSATAPDNASSQGGGPAE